MISVAEKDFDAEVLEKILRNTFHRGERADRSFHHTVRRGQTTGAPDFLCRDNIEPERHWGDSSN